MCTVSFTNGFGAIEFQLKLTFRQITEKLSVSGHTFMAAFLLYFAREIILFITLFLTIIVILYFIAYKLLIDFMNTLQYLSSAGHFHMACAEQEKHFVYYNTFSNN